MCLMSKSRVGLDSSENGHGDQQGGCGSDPDHMDQDKNRGSEDREAAQMKETFHGET